LVEVREDNGRRPWLRKSRAAALGFGLGATLALSPLVWAENPAGTNNPPPVGNSAGETMTSPMALMHHQSFAPLVKKVSPAVVNISVTQSGASDTTAEEPEQGTSPDFPNSPFDEFLRRFFDQHTFRKCREDKHIGSRSGPGSSSIPQAMW
jgi:serine protease Do